MRPAADPELVDRVDACLPQIQCARCGYPGCYPYAQAIVAGEANINRCPPGGEPAIQALAGLLHIPPVPLDPAIPGPTTRMLARIIETGCIGCTLCLRACPVDAIVGARKQMHTVLIEACTGCGLCLSPCPTDCIELIPRPAPAAGPWPGYSLEESNQARQAWRKRQERLARKKSGTTAREESARTPDRDAIRAEIQAAVARVRGRRNGTAVPFQPPNRPLK